MKVKLKAKVRLKHIRSVTGIWLAVSVTESIKGGIKKEHVDD